MKNIITYGLLTALFIQHHSKLTSMEMATMQTTTTMKASLSVGNAINQAFKTDNVDTLKEIILRNPSLNWHSFIPGLINFRTKPSPLSAAAVYNAGDCIRFLFDSGILSAQDLPIKSTSGATALHYAAHQTTDKSPLKAKATTAILEAMRKLLSKANFSKLFTMQYQGKTAAQLAAAVRNSNTVNALQAYASSMS